MRGTALVKIHTNRARKSFLQYHQKRHFEEVLWRKAKRGKFTEENQLVQFVRCQISRRFVIHHLVLKIEIFHEIRSACHRRNYNASSIW